MGERIASVLLAVGEQEAPERLAQVLREAGIEVAVAPASAAPGLERLDVAVVEMSALTGGAVWAAQARARHPDVELVVVATTGELPAALRALRQGASDLLASPLEPAALLDAVARAADRGLARAAARDASDLGRWAELGRMAGGLTHEIANAVAVILSALSAVEDGVSALERAGGAAALGIAPALEANADARARAQVRDAAQEASAGATRLKVLARDLRSVVRADATSLAPADVSEAVQSALRLGRAEIAAHAQVLVDVPPGLTALASQGALTEALLHLLVAGAGAIAAAGARRGPLWVRAERRGEAVRIEIENAAPPPPPDPKLRHLALRIPPGLLPGPDARRMAVARELVERQGGSCTGRRSGSGGTVVEVALRAPALPPPSA